MTTKDIKTVTIGGVKFTQHHIVIFILTFFRLNLVHLIIWNDNNKQLYLFSYFIN